jgi:hypothetical protein
LEAYQPQVKIVSPSPDEVLDDTTVSVQFQVQDLPTFKDGDLGMGPHLHVILDNQPYRAVYDIDRPLVFEDLSPGTHTIRAFASRPWHESFKNEGAYAQTTFHLFTKTDDNNPDPALPLLTYSRPKGTYGAEPILLDFYLTNAPLHLVAQENPEDEITDWRIRVTINGQSFVLDRWQPVYLEGFKSGKNWVKLEFLDEQGNAVKNAFNTTARLIRYEPGGTDTLSKLVRGELTAEEARSIVEPGYKVQPKPTPSPLPTPTPTAEPTPSPSPTPTPTAEPTPETPEVEETPTPEPTAPEAESPPPAEPEPGKAEPEKGKPRRFRRPKAAPTPPAELPEEPKTPSEEPTAAPESSEAQPPAVQPEAPEEPETAEPAPAVEEPTSEAEPTSEPSESPPPIESQPESSLPEEDTSPLESAPVQPVQPEKPKSKGFLKRFRRQAPEQTPADSEELPPTLPEVMETPPSDLPEPKSEVVPESESPATPPPEEATAEETPDTEVTVSSETASSEADTASELEEQEILISPPGLSPEPQATQKSNPEESEVPNPPSTPASESSESPTIESTSKDVPQEEETTPELR